MSSVRVNVHRQPNPRDVAQKFFNDHVKTKPVFWDKNGHGISLCAGKDWEYEAQRYPDRFIKIKNDLDLDEVFRNYEDGE